MRNDAERSGGFVVREFAPGDGDVVRRIVADVLREYGLSGDRRGIDADLDDIAQNYPGRGGLFLVVDAGNAIVGCGGLYPIDAEEAEIRKMYLLPDARGRGLGKRLLLALLDGARTGGFSRVTLETASALKEAIALYRSFGFRPVERGRYAGRCDQAFELQLKDFRVREKS